MEDYKIKPLDGSKFSLKLNDKYVDGEVNTKLITKFGGQSIEVKFIYQDDVTEEYCGIGEITNYTIFGTRVRFAIENRDTKEIQHNGFARLTKVEKDYPNTGCVMVTAEMAINELPMSNFR